MAVYDGSTWSKAQDIIKKELNNDQAFSLWFGPVKFISASADSIKLEVPNQFFQTWIVDHYLRLLQKAVAKAAGQELTIDFLIKNPDEKEVVPKPDQISQKKDPSKPFWPFSRDKDKQDAAKEIGLNPNNIFEEFVKGSGNEFALAASLAVCNSPGKTYNPLFIYGGVGLGKTHLMHAIGHQVLQKFPKAKVVYISSEGFTNELINSIQKRTNAEFRKKYRNVDVLLIDDIQFIAGRASTQEEFFNTFNVLHEAFKQIVVSSDRLPNEIPDLEERLVSRFRCGLLAKIEKPDFETRIAILKKKSERETITLPDDIFFFLAEKITSNIRELEGALIRVVAYAKLLGKDVSVELAKNVLKDMISESEKKITIDFIQQKVSEYFNIKLSDMKTKRRSRAIAYPRQIAMYLSRNLTDFSLPEIGEQFGGRDHTTVIHAYEKIESDIKGKKGLKDTLDRLLYMIKG